MDEKWKDENKELFMSLDEKEETDKDGSDEDAGERESIYLSGKGV